MSVYLPAEPKVHEFDLEVANKAGVRIFLVAAELHNPLAGNKHLKLQPWLQRVKAEGSKGLIGVGGAWSNFILSLALASNQAGIACAGIIRGAEHQPAQNYSPSQSTAMLQDAALAGMKLHFVSRAEFRRRAEPAWQQQWLAAYPDYLYVPEGGSSLDSARACRALMPQNLNATHWVIAAGTGATAAGLLAAIPVTDNLLVINISGDQKLQQQVLDWSTTLYLEGQMKGELIAQSAAEITARVTFPAHQQPRFGKLTAGLCELANNCFEQTGILLDPVYTVKAMQQVQWMLQCGEFQAGARIALIHTGGLQGWRGYLNGYSSFLSQGVREYIDSLYLQP